MNKHVMCSTNDEHNSYILISCSTSVCLSVCEVCYVHAVTVDRMAETGNSERRATTEDHRAENGASHTSSDDLSK